MDPFASLRGSPYSRKGDPLDRIKTKTDYGKKTSSVKKPSSADFFRGMIPIPYHSIGIDEEHASPNGFMSPPMRYSTSTYFKRRINYGSPTTTRPASPCTITTTSTAETESGSDILSSNNSPRDEQSHRTKDSSNPTSPGENKGSVQSLLEWKQDFVARLHSTEEDLCYAITHEISHEEKMLIIRQSITELKVGVSDLLNTLTLLVNKLVNKSQKKVENTTAYWQEIVTGLRNELDHVIRQRDIEIDNRKKLEMEVKKLQNKLSLRSQYQSIKSESFFASDEVAQLHGATPNTTAGTEERSSTPTPEKKTVVSAASPSPMRRGTKPTVPALAVQRSTSSPSRSSSPRAPKQQTQLSSQTPKTATNASAKRASTTTAKEAPSKQTKPTTTEKPQTPKNANQSTLKSVDKQEQDVTETTTDTTSTSAAAVSSALTQHSNRDVSSLTVTTTTTTRNEQESALPSHHEVVEKCEAIESLSPAPPAEIPTITASETTATAEVPTPTASETTEPEMIATNTTTATPAIVVDATANTTSTTSSATTNTINISTVSVSVPENADASFSNNNNNNASGSTKTTTPPETSTATPTPTAGEGPGDKAQEIRQKLRNRAMMRRMAAGSLLEAAEFTAPSTTTAAAATPDATATATTTTTTISESTTMAPAIEPSSHGTPTATTTTTTTTASENSSITAESSTTTTSTTTTTSKSEVLDRIRARRAKKQADLSK